MRHTCTSNIPLVVYPEIKTLNKSPLHSLICLSPSFPSSFTGTGSEEETFWQKDQNEMCSLLRSETSTFLLDHPPPLSTFRVTLVMEEMAAYLQLCEEGRTSRASTVFKLENVREAG